ncbi:MAG: HEAT repeat domain-containing protein [Armatimonadetes bacterium]|nr:HEAT repeat domain-containing protein [Armatimonadota bacterium]
MSVRVIPLTAAIVSVVILILVTYLCLQSLYRMRLLNSDSYSTLNTEKLISIARNSDVEKRLRATLELSRRNSRDAILALIERVRSDKAELVRIAALYALAWRKDEAVDELMLDILRQSQSRHVTEIEIAVKHLSNSTNEPTWHRLVELYFREASTAIEKYAPILFNRLNEASLRPVCQMLGTGIAFKETKSDASMMLQRRQRQLLMLIDSIPKDALIPLLSDNDIAVVAGALQLLIKFPIEDAAPKLAELANSKHRIIRVLAASALAMKPSIRVAGEIKQLAKISKDKYVRACATVALSSIGKAELKEVEKLLNSKDAIERKLALQALSHMKLSNKEMIDKLKVALNDPDMEVRLTASMMLLRHGEDALKLFLKALERTHGDERASMLLALRNIKSKETLKVAAKDLMSDEPQVRWAAGVAISSYGEEALPLLSEMLKHNDERVRIGALNALTQIGTNRAVELVAKAALSDNSKLVRISAIESLSAFPGNAQAIGALSKLLESQDDEIAMRAALALGKVGQSGLRILKDALKSDKVGARLAAARVLAFYGDAESMKMLWDIASKGDGMMKLTALQALARAGDEDAMTRLIKMLATKDEMERMKVRAAILGLRESAIEPLKAALNDDDELIRAEAALLLSQLLQLR